jgi:ribosome-associated heat shock protein Hsp15
MSEPNCGSSPGSPASPPQAQRVDKWLWYARIFKSRSLSAKFVETGKIRVMSAEQRTKLTKPSQSIRTGDVLTFPHGDHIRILKVLAPGKRRGPAPEAQALYQDLTPAPPKKDASPTSENAPSRPKGEGRPTKKDRRALDRLQDDTE